MIGEMPEFGTLHRTRIGSPFVIAAMEAVLADDPAAKVVGYEANGGFLLGFTAEAPAGPLEPLMTRDCLLPILAPLALARAGGKDLAALVAALPPRFTAARSALSCLKRCCQREHRQLCVGRADFGYDHGAQICANDVDQAIMIGCLLGGERDAGENTQAVTQRDAVCQQRFQQARHGGE